MEAERKNSRLEPERYDLEILLRRPSLRTNIPRRVSQVRREAITDKDTACGLGRFRSEWLQSFANRKTYIFLYGVLGSFYSSYCAHFYGIMTTLEKQFRFSSRTVGFIATISDITLLFACFVLSIRIPRTHKPSWIGLGIYIIVASGLLSTMPHFLHGSEGSWKKFDNMTYRNGTSKIQRCFEDSLSCSYKKSEGNFPFVILFLSQVTLGVGGSLFFTLGRSYTEENIEMYQAPALLCLLVILKTLGPASGYWLSSMCLKIFVSPGTALALNENNPHWIGAWWLGNLIISFMLFTVGAFIILFPSRLPKAALRRVSREEKTEFSKGNQTLEEGKKTFYNLIIKTVKYFGESSRIINLGFIAYFAFLPKYVEIQYGQSPSSANLITGSGTLICAAFGTVVASSIITRYRPCIKALAAWDAFVGLLLISSLTSLIYFGCHENDDQIKALTTQVHNTKSINCQCDEFQFFPICDEQQRTFISTCHYCCSDNFYNKTEKIHSDCLHYLLNSNQTEALSLGVCPVDCHNRYMIFTIITCSVAFAYATTHITKLCFKMEHTDKKLTSNKLSLCLTLIRLITFIPTPILFGHILDKTCLLWNNDISESGNCWFYDSRTLRYLINLTAAGFAIISTGCDLGNWYLIENQAFDDTDHHEDEYNES